MAIFQLPRWRPSAILDLWWACLDHPRRGFDGLYHCANFGWNQYSNFNNMQLVIFSGHAWRPQNWCFWGFDPLNGKAYQRNLKQAHPWVERRHMTYTSSRSVHQHHLCTWRRDQTKKETWQWQTGYSPRPPTSSDQNEILHGGWSSGSSSRFQISSNKSIKRFRSCGFEFVISHWLGHWLIQQLVRDRRQMAKTCQFTTNCKGDRVIALKQQISLS